MQVKDCRCGAAERVLRHFSLAAGLDIFAAAVRFPKRKSSAEGKEGQARVMVAPGPPLGSLHREKSTHL